MKNHVGILILMIAFPSTSVHSARQRCPAVVLANGKAQTRSRGRIIQFKCFRGYMMLGEPYAACIRGKWDPDPPVCLKPGCTPIRSLKNGFVSDSMRSAFLEFSCKPGFKLIGPSFIYCNGRRWSAMQPYCKAADISCNFEDDSTCSWIVEVHDDDDFMWHIQQHEPASRVLGTGPKHDHTHPTNDSGHFLMIESGDYGSSSDVLPARIHSPKFPSPFDNNTCFIFWYHMFGSSVGMLNVFLNNKLVFQEKGNHGDRWIKGVVPLTMGENDMLIIIEGTHGRGISGNVGLDDFYIGNSTDCEFSRVKSCGKICYEPPKDTDVCLCTRDCYVDSSCCEDFSNVCDVEGESSTTSDDYEDTIFEELTSSTTQSADLDESGSSYAPLFPDSSNSFSGSTALLYDRSLDSGETVAHTQQTENRSTWESIESTSTQETLTNTFRITTRADNIFTPPTNKNEFAEQETTTYTTEIYDELNTTPYFQKDKLFITTPSDKSYFTENYNMSLAVSTTNSINKRTNYKTTGKSQFGTTIQPEIKKSSVITRLEATNINFYPTKPKSTLIPRSKIYTKFLKSTPPFTKNNYSGSVRNHTFNSSVTKPLNTNYSLKNHKPLVYLTKIPQTNLQGTNSSGFQISTPSLKNKSFKKKGEIFPFLFDLGYNKKKKSTIKVGEIFYTSSKTKTGFTQRASIVTNTAEGPHSSVSEIPLGYTLKHTEGIKPAAPKINTNRSIVNLERVSEIANPKSWIGFTSPFLSTNEVPQSFALASAERAGHLFVTLLQHALRAGSSIPGNVHAGSTDHRMSSSFQTYVVPTALVLVALTFGVILFCFISRRRPSLQHRNGSEGDVLYASSEEMLDFSLARPNQR